jgi:hypothetical protein
LIGLADQLLIVDPFEQLPCKLDARLSTPLLDLIEKAVADQLQTLLDQLVVDLALSLDLFGCLELSRESGLELSEANIVKASRVDVITSDPPAGLIGDLDGTIDRPIRVL